MKLGPDTYYVNPFNIPKHEGVNKWAGEGHNQKTTRKYHDIKRISTFTYLKPTQIMLKRRRFFTAIHNHLTLAFT